MSDQPEFENEDIKSAKNLQFFNRFNIFNSIIIIGLVTASQIHWCVTHDQMNQLLLRVVAAILFASASIWPLVRLLRFIGRRYWGLEEYRDTDKAIAVALMPLSPLVLVAGFPISETYFKFIIRLGLSGFLATLLAGVFVLYGTALSNRRQLGRQFAPMAMITMAVISYVGGSLALSLGMVGALSIVRFRTAIKDPEELVYLFAAIAIGLGMGGGYPAETAIATLLLLCFLIGRSIFRVKSGQRSFHLTLQVPDGSTGALDRYSKTISKCLGRYNIRRVDHTSESIEITFLIDVPSTESLNILMSNLREQHPQASLVLLDGQALLS